MSVPRLRYGALYNMQQLSYSNTCARTPCCDIIHSTSVPSPDAGCSETETLTTTMGINTVEDGKQVQRGTRESSAHQHTPTLVRVSHSMVFCEFRTPYDRCSATTVIAWKGFAFRHGGHNGCRGAGVVVPYMPRHCYLQSEQRRERGRS